MTRRTTAAEKAHPLRGARVNVYALAGGSADASKYLAFFDQSKFRHIYFEGATYQEALDRAVHWRDSMVERHEATYLSRLVAIEKAREARAKKAAAK